jgi:transcriptional regulator with XRE-family HTH domain
MTEAKPTLNEALARVIRERRGRLGLSQDELARSLWPLDYFTRNMIAAIERGVRDLTVLEAIRIAAALGTDLAGLLADAGELHLTEDTTIHGQGVMGDVWTVRKGPDTVQYNIRTGSMASFGDAIFRVIGHLPEADQVAGKRLGVDPATVSLAAERLWGQSLSEERDERVSSTTGPDATKRTIQAARGHVTRALLAELKAHLDQETKPK